MFIYATNFDKRLNSTAIPDDYATRFEVKLKERCSWRNPIFILNVEDFDYNYIRWGDWFYYVSDVVYVRNNLLEVNCSVDSLATFRGAIFSSRQFVAYADIANTEISDSRLSLKTTSTRRENIAAATGDFIGKGRIVVVNALSGTRICTYQLTPDNALRLLNTLDNYINTVVPDTSSSTFSWTDIGASFKSFADYLNYALKQALTSGKVPDAVKSSYILPISGATSGSSVMLGNFDTGIPAHVVGVDGRITNDSMSVAIPWQATDWRRNAPYHEIYVYVPFVGNISIPPASIIGCETITANYAFDRANGDCICVLSGEPITGGRYQRIIGVYSINFSGSFPLGSAIQTPSQIATSIGMGAATVAATIATGGIAAAVAAGTAGIVGVTNNLQPNTQTVITGGGAVFTGLNDTAMHCMSIYHDTIVPPEYNSAIIGQPFMKVTQLANIAGGYCECRNAHVALQHGFDNMSKDIDNYLNGGVYLE